MRGIRTAVVLLILGVAAAVPTAASSSIIGHSSGPVSVAHFSQTDASGCLVTDLDNLAFTGRQTVSGLGSGLRIDLTAFITVTDICSGTVETFLGCFTSPGDAVEVTIDRDLTTAIANGTITCTDFDTGATCTLSKSETLRGVGEITRDRGHFVQREEGVLLIDVFRTEIRDAEVTVATITGCGVSFSEEDFVFAQLLNGVSTNIQIIR
jgi:hypothetical protein